MRDRGVSGSGTSPRWSTTDTAQVESPRLTPARSPRSGAPGPAHRRITGVEQLGHRVILVDQSPIRRTAALNPANYIGLFDQIRDLLLQDAGRGTRGYKPGTRPSPSTSRAGACEVGRGDGQIKSR